MKLLFGTQETLLELADNFIAIRPDWPEMVSVINEAMKFIVSRGGFRERMKRTISKDHSELIEYESSVLLDYDWFPQSQTPSKCVEKFIFAIIPLFFGSAVPSKLQHSSARKKQFKGAHSSFKAFLGQLRSVMFFTD